VTKPPNFLPLMTDQQRADHLGCYGNRILATPQIDGLARPAGPDARPHDPRDARAVRYQPAPVGAGV